MGVIATQKRQSEERETEPEVWDKGASTRAIRESEIQRASAIKVQEERAQRIQRMMAEYEAQAHNTRLQVQERCDARLKSHADTDAKLDKEFREAQAKRAE